MNELTLSPMYGVLLSNYLIKVKRDQAVSALSESALKDVNDMALYTSRISQVGVEALIKDIFEATGDMSFGLDIGKTAHPSDYGTVGYTLMNCSSLFQVFDYAAKYKHASNKAFKILFTKQNNFYRFRIDSLVETQWLKVIIELDFVTALYLSRFFVGVDKAKKVIPYVVNFKHEPFANIDKYHRIFGCEVKFNQAINEIVFPQSVFDIPIRSANSKLFKLMESKLVQAQKGIEEKLSLKQKLNQYIQDNIESGVPSLTSTANDFNMSVSSLKSHLKTEKTNYSHIVDEVRKSIALKLVLDPENSILEISMYLGFSNSSTFNRAFKRWTNLTPVRYRKLGATS